MAGRPTSGSRRMFEKKPDAALLGVPGRMQMVGKRRPMPSKMPAPGVVGQQQLADRLLRAVAGQGRRVILVRDREGQRRADDCDGRGEDHARAVALLRADRVEEVPRAVQVDRIALVEIRLGLARDDGGEVEDHVRPVRHHAGTRSRLRQIGRQRRDRATETLGPFRRDQIGQRQLRDLASAQAAVPCQTRGQFAAQHPCRARDQDMHGSPFAFLYWYDCLITADAQDGGGR